MQINAKLRPNSYTSSFYHISARFVAGHTRTMITKQLGSYNFGKEQSNVNKLIKKM